MTATGLIQLCKENSDRAAISRQFKQLHIPHHSLHRTNIYYDDKILDQCTVDYPQKLKWKFISELDKSTLRINESDEITQQYYLC